MSLRYDRFSALHNEAVKELLGKINQLEKFIWMAIGGGMVVTWALTNLVHFLK
jgi:hypothetical protein